VVQKIMIVVPAYNEEACLPELIARLDRVAGILMHEQIEMTLVVVDDASKDGTKLVPLHASHTNISILFKELSCNVGHQQALWEGLNEFSSEYSALIFMDADLQDPPEVIIDLIKHWFVHSDNLVIAVRENRESDSKFKRLSAAYFYKVMTLLTEKSKRGDLYNAGDFRLLDSSLALALKQNVTKSGLPPLRFLTLEMAHSVGVVPFVRASRFSGESKYGFLDMLALAFESIFKSGHFAYRMLQFFSMFTGVSSFAVSAYLLISKTFVQQETSPGWISLTLISLSAIFIQSTLLLLLSSELRVIRKNLLTPRVLISDSRKTISTWY